MIGFRHVFFRGINATIEVYIQYTDSLIKFFNSYRDRYARKNSVIEDDDVMRELMRMALEQNGYEVTTAEDGVRGYDAALFLKPDLIVTDIQMPGADGIHVVRRVRDTASLETTPILVTTAFGTGTGTFSLQIGANAFEPKPINSQSFLSTVKRLLVDRDSQKAA
jgi:DNA-binding response OmpR family regulator